MHCPDSQDCLLLQAVQPSSETVVKQPDASNVSPSYISTSEGDLAISDGGQVWGLPQAELQPGPVHVAACSYAVAGASDAATVVTFAAGEPVVVAVTARDRWGNLAQVAPAGLQASATGPGGSVPLQPVVRSPILSRVLRLWPDP